MPVDELVDNRWTTGPDLGATRPLLWMIRAIPRNSGIRCPHPLRRPSVRAKNLCHATRDGRPAGRETSRSAGIRTGSSRKRALGSRSPQGVPNWRAAPGKAPSGRQTPSRPGSAQVRRAMAACPAGSRTERSDHGNRGTERPLPSHTWKGPLPTLHHSRRFRLPRRRHADADVARPRHACASLPAATASARSRIPFSIRRIIGKSAHSISTTVISANGRRHS